MPEVTPCIKDISTLLIQPCQRGNISKLDIIWTQSFVLVVTWDTGRAENGHKADPTFANVASLIGIHYRPS